MATNYSPPGRDYPSRSDVEQMEREDREREREYNRREDKVQGYLRNHPGASWAEANYHTKGE